MGKIQIQTGTYSSSNTDMKHLVEHHLIDPSKNIDNVIQYAEKRHLMTFLTSRVSEGRYTAPGYTGKDTAKTMIKEIPEKEMIDDIAWKYQIMGRIQKSCEILGTGAVGTPTTATTTSGGFFQIRLKDNHITPGMNVIFYNGSQARCMSNPSGTAGVGYLYTFQCYPGETFSWTTWVAPQTGTKTCFGGWTSYGERSLRGYGAMFYPDTYINHMSTQRKGINISGDANTQAIRIYEYNGEKGFVYESEAQNRAAFLLEDESEKWWGKSTMKDSLGNLLSTPSMTDSETGEPIYRGDGWVEQVSGANDFESSGTDGTAVYDDFADMLIQLKKKTSGDYMNNFFYAVTGADGMENANNRISTWAKDRYHITQNITQTNEIGGADVAAGFNFNKLNVAGQQLVFCENPRMDDVEMHPRTLDNGDQVMSHTYYILDQSTLGNGRSNIEIRTRGRGNINRNFVYYVENGMTGDGKPMSSVDAKKIEMLKQNMLVVYSSKSCGIITPAE